MKKFFCLGVFALTMIASCQKEEFAAVDSQVDLGFKVTATLDENDLTRTQLSETGYKVMWSAGDAISVLNNGKHYKYNVDDIYAGKATADFSYDPTFGTITGGIETGISKYVFVGVYPFAEETTVSAAGESAYVINTVIPSVQNYAAASFGKDASPMIGIANGTPEFSFKNVGSMLIMSLTGNGNIITSATLESKAHKIAGAASITVDAENEWIPVADMTNGESKVVLSCGEGVQLDPEVATYFYFVLAPGTYEANDLSVKFVDSYGNYYVREIGKENTFVRSKGLAFSTKTFEAKGTEQVDLWVKAQASAYMTAERIIPSVDNLNVEAWVKALMNQPDTKDRLEQAVTYLSLGQYDLVFDVLGGIPGFVKDLKRYEATGTYTQKVDYTGASYLVSMVEGIEKINDIESLLAFMNEFEGIYEASGLKNKLDESLGSIADNFDAYIDAFIDANYKKPEQDNTLSEEEAFAQYKAKISKQLATSIDGCNYAINAIDEYNSKLAQLFGKKGLGERASMATFVSEAQSLSDDLPNITTIDEIKERVLDLDKIEVNLASIIKFNVDPNTFLTGADSEYEKYMDNLNNQILGNKELVNAAKAYVRSQIEEIQGASIVGSLETAVKEPDSWTGKVLNYLFSQETFLESVKKSLRDIVTGIEEDAKDKIDNGNVDLKAEAIESSKNNALLYARAEAIKSIDKQLAATNEANLNGGPWGIFKRVLNWEKCVQLFTECGILDVYNALCDFAAIVDQIYTYNRTAVYYDIENFADYQENVDWWVLTYSEEF